METIVVAELEKYWITFEQLLQRWNIKDNLLASYCVCIDTSKGNCPLTPHFYQGEFLVPGGGVYKKFAIYEPRYKNTAEYINKNKTEYQLVQEFLDSIIGIKRDEIWFPISSVEELEENDYSLAVAAQNYLKENSRYAEKAFTYLNQQSTNIKEQKNISSKSSTVFVYEIEDVLKEVFKWHLADPKNLALYVGLLRLQKKKNEETYRIAWKCYGENIPKESGRSVRYQWEKFLEYAEQKGMDREMLNNMIS